MLVCVFPSLSVYVTVASPLFDAIHLLMLSVSVVSFNVTSIYTSPTLDESRFENPAVTVLPSVLIVVPVLLDVALSIVKAQETVSLTVTPEYDI